MDSKSENALQNLGNVKVDQLLLTLVKYVNSLDTVERALTIRIKLCTLLQTVSYFYPTFYPFLTSFPSPSLPPSLSSGDATQ